MYLEMSASACFIADFQRNSSASDFITFSVNALCALYVKQQLMPLGSVFLRIDLASIG